MIFKRYLKVYLNTNWVTSSLLKHCTSNIFFYISVCQCHSASFSDCLFAFTLALAVLPISQQFPENKKGGQYLNNISLVVCSLNLMCMWQGDNRGTQLKDSCISITENAWTKNFMTDSPSIILMKVADLESNENYMRLGLNPPSKMG